MPPRSPLECPGVWEVRGYTGRDREGNPTQVSRTAYGSKRDARRIAAELTVKPSRNAGGRKVAQLLDEWLEQDAGTVSPWTGACPPSTAERRRGVQVALLGHRMDHVRRMGSDLVVTTAAAGGASERKLLRHGSTPEFTIPEFS